MEPINALPGFTFGCDPELAVMDDKGRFVSADPFIPGTKEEPYKVKDGAVQLDGVAAEFNIDPVDNFEDFHYKINSVMGQMQQMLPKGYQLVAVSAVEFDEDVWDNIPDSSKELGCTPDMNAWTGDVNPPPSDPENPRLRTFSGHIHNGWTSGQNLSDVQHITNCRDLVRQLDWFLGAWSISKDSDPRRRRLYGKAGACRYKDYGVEYRVLSNFWLKDKKTRLEMWNRLCTGINSMRTGFYPQLASQYGFNDRLIQSIDTTTMDAKLIQKFSFPITSFDPYA